MWAICLVRSQPVELWSSTLLWAGSTSMTVVALTVPNHTPSCRAGYCQLVSQVGHNQIYHNQILFFFFFNILCSNRATVTAARISFVCGLALLKSRSRYAFEQSLMCLLQLQAADCEMSSALRVSPLIAKSKLLLIECRAATLFSKVSRI